ncbi:MAG: lactonase family protein [Acidobacteria bacterium]|nr:lactonase family protein [Acidobacteriota bacterium]
MTESRHISRRAFIAAAALLPTANIKTMAQDKNDLTLYVGTYTSGTSSSKGIYFLRFDTKTGRLSKPYLAAETEEPSFLTVSSNGNFLYAVNETLEYEGKSSGYVTAFSIDKKTGSLKFINRQPSHGAAPCHISITKKGDLVLVANYMSGTVALFPTGKDGSLLEASDIKQHSGKGPNAARQEAPHAHSIMLSDDENFVLVNDLGIDRVVTYALDKQNKKLIATGGGHYTNPGAGPRHFKFHPNGKFAFINNELDMTVSSLAFEKRSGGFTEIETHSTLPVGRKSKSDSVADLHLSPDGRFLYVSNRGHNSIAVFAINQKSGSLTAKEFVSTGGKTPRNFAIDPTGRFIFAANQDSGTITVFKRHKQTGKLTQTNISAKVPKPVCLVFAPATK